MTCCCREVALQYTERCLEKGARIVALEDEVRSLQLQLKAASGLKLHLPRPKDVPVEANGHRYFTIIEGRPYAVVWTKYGEEWVLQSIKERPEWEMPLG